MYPNLHISSTNSLTQNQQLEIAELTTFCRHHDGIDLSYPSEEDDLTHFLAYLPDGHLAACLALIPYEDDLMECSAFTHPDDRQQGCFTRLLEEALSRHPDTDLLFAVSEKCPDTLKTLEALDAEKDSEEHIMECSLSSYPHSTAGNGLRNHHPFSITRTSGTEYALSCSGVLCGFASAESVCADTVCLHHVEIVPEYRNRGYGTAFLLLLLPALSKEGFQKAVLQVSGDNAAAIALYKKTGFSVTKTLSYYFY